MKKINEGRVQVVSGTSYPELISGTTVVAGLSCQTDFLAKSDIFENALNDICHAFINSGDVDAIVKRLKMDTGEEIRLRHAFIEIPHHTPTAFYIHHDKKKVALVQFSNYDGEYFQKALKLAYDISMHIVAFTPSYTSIEDVNWDDVDLSILPELLEGKSEFVIEKIEDGKKKKFAEENILLEQPFIKDKDKKVLDLIMEFNLAYNSSVFLKDFIYIAA